MQAMGFKLAPGGFRCGLEVLSRPQAKAAGKMCQSVAYMMLASGCRPHDSAGRVLAADNSV